MTWLTKKVVLIVVDVALLVLAWHYRHEIEAAVHHVVHFIKNH